VICWQIPTLFLIGGRITFVLYEVNDAGQTEIHTLVHESSTSEVMIAIIIIRLGVPLLQITYVDF
jgi:hypothetical protein